MTDWDEQLLLTDWAATANGWRCETRELATLDPYPQDIYHAMMVGLRDYVRDNGFPGVILGMSGGIDSALSAAVAVDALGPDKVWCVMLPSEFTSDAQPRGCRGSRAPCSGFAMTSSRSSPRSRRSARCCPESPASPRRISRRGCGW